MLHISNIVIYQSVKIPIILNNWCDILMEQPLQMTIIINNNGIMAWDPINCDGIEIPHIIQNQSLDGLLLSLLIISDDRSLLFGK